jgi:hypothetical protein
MKQLQKMLATTVDDVEAVLLDDVEQRMQLPSGVELTNAKNLPIGARFCNFSRPSSIAFVLECRSSKFHYW